MTRSAAGCVFNARLVTLAPGQEPFTGYLAWDERGRITAIGEGAPDPSAFPDAVDAHGAVVMPGFLSGHAHLWQSLFRGIADGCSTVGWIEQLHRRVGPAFQSGDMHSFTRHGAIDNLRHGVTTVCNMSQDLGGGTVEQLRAAESVDQRTVYIEGLAIELTADERRERIQQFAEAPADEERVIGRAVDVSDWGMDVPAMQRESELIAALGLGTHSHYLEDPTVAHQGQARFEALLAGGRFAQGLVMAHFIHVPERVLAEVASRGAAMVWNPLSNGRLGSGLPDIPAYLEAGLGVGMGLDGQASADISDPFENLRMGMYGLRMRAKDASVLDCRRVLELHTVDTARIFGVDHLVGSLEVGKYADFIVVDPHSPDTGYVADDLITHLVLSCSASNIRAVHVGGRLAAEPASATPEEVVAEQAEARERARLLRERWG